MTLPSTSPRCFPLVQDDVLDVMLYLRCLSALIAGITVGCLGLEGLYIFLG